MWHQEDVWLKLLKNDLAGHEKILAHVIESNSAEHLMTVLG